MMEVVTEWEGVFDSLEDCIQQVIYSISKDDTGRLNALLGKLNDFKNLLGHIHASVDEENTRSELLQYLSFVSHLEEEAEQTLARFEGEVLLPEDSLPTENYTGVGRPRKFVPEQEVRELHNARLSWSRIARFFHVSPKTLMRRRKDFNLEGNMPKTDISNEDLDLVIRSIKAEHPTAGYTYVWSNLKALSIFVTYKRLKDRMKIVDALGIFSRSRKKIPRRRKYRTKGTHYLWNLDGNEKFVAWKGWIHGCVDSHSKQIIYLSLAHNKTSERVLDIFAAGVEKHGMPVRVRGDGGSENVMVKEFMVTCKPELSNPFIVGRSVHNTPIERMWAEVNRVVSEKFRSIFFSLEEDGILNQRSMLHILCLSYVYFHRVNRSLQNFVTVWNLHPLSTRSSFTPEQLSLLSIIAQRYSNSLSASQPQHVHSSTTNVTFMNYDPSQYGTSRNNPLTYKQLLDFCHLIPLEELQEFESEAMEVVPDPLAEDGDDGKILYAKLIDHFHTQ